MVGTIFEKSRTHLQLWFYAIFLFTTSRHGVSGKELQRQLGVTYKTAYRMGKLIREHMAAIDGDEKLGGEGKIVEVDETYFGKNTGKRGRNLDGKVAVVGMVERGGDATVKVVTRVSREVLYDVIGENVEKGTELHTDQFNLYNGIDREGYDHKRINKKKTGKYVGPNGESVNSVENFWRHLKQSIKGTHISVSPEKLETYAKEFEYPL
jgi:transposase-like protein